MKLSSALASEYFNTAIGRVSGAIRKLATAASRNFGGDCYLHMQLGQLLLADLAIETQQVVGFAAWRVGMGNGDVIVHVPDRTSKLPVAGQGFPYHAWLSHHELVVDLTTYQLKYKAQQQDASDGGRTTVTWCPEFLLISQHQTNSLEQVTAGLRPGLAYYESHPELQPVLRPKSGLDPDDVARARFLLAYPGTNVLAGNRQ